MGLGLVAGTAVFAGLWLRPTPFSAFFGPGRPPADMLDFSDPFLVSRFHSVFDEKTFSAIISLQKTSCCLNINLVQ